MPIERAAQLAGQVFDALAHAHRAGVVHRDLKPANLMLTESGLVKIMDFGLARMAGTEHLTNDGYMLGTPAYMSPEQVLGWEIDGRADLYAMGVVLFRLLTGQLPFNADSGIAMAHKQINDPPTPVRQLRTELSWQVEEVLKKALAKPPGDRYQTADEFKAAMASVVGAPGGLSPEATPTLSMSRSGAWPDNERPMPSASVPAAPAPVPTAAPPAATVVMPAHAPSASASSSGRRMPIAAAVALGVVVLAGVPAVMMWRARAAQPETASVAPVTQAPAPAVEAPPEAPAAKGPQAVQPPDPAGPRPPLAGGPVSSGTKGTEAAKAGATTPPKEPVAPVTTPAALPIVTFGKLRLLIIEEGKSRDRDASLSLGANALEVLDGEKTLHRMPYSEIVGVFHSHSREPRWTAPDGKSVPVGKVGGKFSFLKGAPDWITVRTKQSFIPLRVPDDDVGQVIKELESRIGTKVVRVR
jgi:serine/threonine-protein kinase